jgi:hypothetical protein
MGKKVKKGQETNTIKNDERIKKLDALLALIDSPNEGDEVFFTLQGDSTKYRGIIKKKAPQQGAAIYEIVAKTHPAPRGPVDTIEYRGRVFKSGGWRPL